MSAAGLGGYTAEGRREIEVSCAAHARSASRDSPIVAAKLRISTQALVAAAISLNGIAA